MNSSTRYISAYILHLPIRKVNILHSESFLNSWQFLLALRGKAEKNKKNIYILNFLVYPVLITLDFAAIVCVITRRVYMAPTNNEHCHARKLSSFFTFPVSLFGYRERSQLLIRQGWSRILICGQNGNRQKRCQKTSVRTPPLQIVKLCHSTIKKI